MKYSIFIALLLVGIVSCEPRVEMPPDSTEKYEGYTLKWSEDFDGPAISNLNWTYELGDGTDYGLPPGWGNDELQLYTNNSSNSYIEMDAEGVSALVISANEESEGNYTSAKLTTQGLQSFRYGRIESRMKMPFGQGMWPAFWMLGDNITEVDWPGCGEIDIMEMVGFQPSTVHGTVHYTTSENKLNSIGESDMISSGNLSDDYHDYRIDWTPTEITFSLDEVEYHTVSLEDDMKEFQRSFYLILNIAVGGAWPGSPDETTNFPQKMYIDYIHYYSKNDLTAPAPPELDVDEETIGQIISPDKAQHAFNSSLSQFPEIELKAFGAGGEPEILSSSNAIDGDSSLVFSYPGGTWGGGWFELETPVDLSAYADGNLIFYLKEPAELSDVELKMEAVSNSSAIFLVSYFPEAVPNGFLKYKIPLNQFVDLDLSEIKVPFSLWNPKDVNGDYPVVDIIVDNIFFEM